VALVVNTGWPRPALYGDGWLGRTGAIGPTAAVLALGWLYDRLVRRKRPAVVLDEHRAGHAVLSGTGPRSEFSPRTDPVRKPATREGKDRPRRRFPIPRRPERRKR
jgi:hypothetical protein